MKKYVLILMLALLVVLAGMTVRRGMAAIGGSPVPYPPAAQAIGGSPVPYPPALGAIGGSPVPYPPRRQAVPDGAGR